MGVVSGCTITQRRIKTKKPMDASDIPFDGFKGETGRRNRRRKALPEKSSIREQEGEMCGRMNAWRAAQSGDRAEPPPEPEGSAGNAAGAQKGCENEPRGARAVSPSPVGGGAKRPPNEGAPAPTSGK